MRLLWLVLLCFLASCGGRTSSVEQAAMPPLFTLPEAPLVDDVLTNVIIGTWEAHSLSITMPTHGDSDTTRFLQITPENWNEIVGLEPVKTYFLANGQYYAEYYDLDGNLMKRPKGLWVVNGNTLMYDEKEPARNRFFQEVQYLDNNFFQFSFIMDYDGDGELDDKAVSVSRKLE